MACLFLYRILFTFQFEWEFSFRNSRHTHSQLENPISFSPVAVTRGLTLKTLKTQATQLPKPISSPLSYCTWRKVFPKHIHSFFYKTKLLKIFRKMGTPKLHNHNLLLSTHYSSYFARQLVLRYILIYFSIYFYSEVFLEQVSRWKIPRFSNCWDHSFRAVEGRIQEGMEFDILLRLLCGCQQLIHIRAKMFLWICTCWQGYVVRYATAKGSSEMLSGDLLAFSHFTQIDQLNKRQSKS